MRMMLRVLFLVVGGFRVSFAGMPISGIDMPDKECSCSKSQQLKHEQFQITSDYHFSCPTNWITQAQKHEIDLDSDRICISDGHTEPPLGKERKIPKKTSQLNILRMDLQHATCPRYIVASHGDNGLGHRHGVVIFTLNLAIEFGFMFVLDNALIHSGPHGAYPEFRELLSLDSLPYDSELNHSRLQYYRVQSRDQFVQNYFSTFRHMCNVIVYASIGHENACHNHFGKSWCFEAWPGAFERARVHLLPRYPPLNATSLGLFEAADRRRALTVAWHVRCGDVTLHRDADFFRNLRALIRSSGLDFQDYIFWQRCDSKFHFLLDLLPSANIIDTDTATALKHMKGADVLVHTGSSFPVSAAVAAPKPQLFFQSNPKENNDGAQRTYSIKVAVNVADDGSLEQSQPFAFVGSEGLLSGVNWTQRHAPHVLRILQALQLHKLARIQGPSESRDSSMTVDQRTALALFQHVSEFRVLSGALSGQDPAELDLWAHNAALAQQLLPTWTVVVYYNGSLAHNLCRLREQPNVQLVEMSGTALPPHRWQHLPLFYSVTKAVVFLGQPAVALTPCFAEAVAEWANGCGGSGSDEVLRFRSCACRSVHECVWGGRGGAMAAAREALAASMRGARGLVADEKEELLLQRIVGSGGREASPSV